MSNNKVRLGDKVRDRVTGLVGIVTARTEYLQGCWRIVVQPQELKDGEPVRSTYIDEPQLEVIEPGAVPAENGRASLVDTTNVEDAEEQPRYRTGGPRPDTPSASRPGESRERSR